MTGRFQTILLIASPRRLPEKLKNFLLWRRVRKNPAALQVWRRHFDSEQYRTQHVDVAASGVDAMLHFLIQGNSELRDPGRDFDIRYYLGRYPEVAAAGVNALLHFALFGSREGRTLPGAAQLADPSLEIFQEAAIYINNQWPRHCPLISVVIPCFNYGRYVEAAIRSALNQTFQNIEVIVVEGGSTDPDTVQEVRRLESLGLPKTRFYYRSDQHLAGDNRNFGIGQAKGRYICCLDADDLLQPTYLEVAVFLAEAFGFDLVTPSVQCFGESAFKWLLRDPIFHAILMENRVASAALFRRSVWAHIGGFRDWGSGSRYVYEDWDFWIRMLGHGFRAISIGEPLALYRVHGKSLTRGSSLELGVQRERLRQANQELIDLWGETPPLKRSVAHPWVNLNSPVEQGASVLFALPFITLGGAEKLLRLLGEKIAAKGKRLIVITTITLPEVVPDDSASFEQITRHVYPLSKLFSDDGKRSQWLLWLMRRYGVDTMLIAGCEFVYHRLPQIRSEFPEMIIVDQLFNDVVHVFNNRRYSECIDATVVPSADLADHLVKEHSADPGSVRVISHGIPLPDPEGPVHSLPRPAEGKVIVGFFGRLATEKAPDYFVEIARVLLSKRDDFYFVMTGTGPERENVLLQIQKAGISRHFFTPGFVEDVTPLMRAVDIAVLPSRIDGMPLAVLEAQALGKPVVASRVGSLPVMVLDRESGFLCEIGDISAFCDRILQLALSPELRAKMGVVGRRTMEQRFSAETMLGSYEKIFGARWTQPPIAFSRGTA